MSAVLVTGGAGFIGSHVCKLLAESGKIPVVYDNLVRENQPAVQWGPLVVGDLSDKLLLRETIEENAIEAVIHFAALAYVRESMCHASMYWQTNVLGTKTLLDAMKEAGVKHIVFSSSCASYGVPAHMPIRVDCPQDPINPYGRTKLTCEWMIRDYAEQHEWDCAILRYFNVSGNDPDLVVGEVHEPETHIMPIMLLKALQSNPEPVRIFGGAHPTPDGTCVRDFIHVMDLAQVHLRVLDFITAQRESVTFNVGLGQGTSILDLLKTCEEVTEKRIPHCLEKPNPGDPPCLIADPGDVWTRLGLSPRFTEMNAMVEHAWQWIRHKRHIWIQLKQKDMKSSQLGGTLSAPVV